MDLRRERQENALLQNKSSRTSREKKKFFQGFLPSDPAMLFKYTLLISRCFRYENIQQLSYTDVQTPREFYFEEALTPEHSKS
jgi:hypothetical protein